MKDATTAERTGADVRLDLDVDRMLEDAVQHPRCEMLTRTGAACGAPADLRREPEPLGPYWHPHDKKEDES